MLSDAELERYSRQLLLSEVDIEGQEKLQAATVLIVGVGGLGHPAALYLAAAGVGRLLLVDGDHVEVSNLARQIGFRTDQVGQLKVSALAATLAQLNPFCRVETRAQRVDETLAARLDEVTLVLDCSDNFATRFAINRACMQTATPLISGAAIRWQGQVACFDPAQPEAGCYRCLFDDNGEPELACSEAGVAGPLVGVVGGFQALLAMRFITQGQLPCRLWRLDAQRLSWHAAPLHRDPDCPVCASRH